MNTRTGVDLEIEQARLSDCAVIVRISEDAAAWARSLGFDAGNPPRPLREIVMERINRGMIYLAYVADDPVATVTLNWHDEPLWRDLPSNALYVHGLMARTASIGSDIGGALLRWAELLAANAGKTAVRLDCMASNTALRAYYRRCGYTFRGDAIAAAYTGSRIEKQVM